MQRSWIALAVAGALGAGGVAAWSASRAGDTAATTGAPSATVAGGAGAAGAAPIVARPAPAAPPAPVAADGECAAALAAVRTITRDHPSGAVLDEAANRTLTEGLAAVDGACPAATATEFRDREVVPWLTYLPPDPE